MTDFSLPEKIGTIFDCFMRNGNREGAFGTLRALGANAYRIDVDGREFTVRRWIGSWAVSHLGVEGLGASVEDAAYLVIDQLRSMSTHTPDYFEAARNNAFR